MDDKPDQPSEEPKKAGSDSDPDGKKAAEKPGQQQSGEKREATNQATGNFGEATSDQINFANKMKQHNNWIRNLNVGREAIRPFSIKLAYDVEQKERDLPFYHPPDEETVNSLRAILEERHIVILTGEAEQGKTAAAIYVGHLFRSLHGRAITESRMVDPLEKNVKIVFADVIKNKKLFGKMLIFRDVFSTENQDVLTFFRIMDEHRLENIAEKLRKNNLFLFFTANVATIDKKCQDSLSSLDIVRQLPMMTEHQLMHGLELKLKEFAPPKGTSIEGTNSIISQADQSLLIQRLRTMPRIARFVKNYLLQLKAGLDFNEALSRFENVDRWFQRELADDFEVWCFAFALGLCQCTANLKFTGDPTGVPWFEFEVFRRAFSRSLAREFNLPRQRKPQFTDCLAEESLTEKCRAEIREHPETGVHYLRFSDNRYPEMLWKCFLQSNRKLVTSVLGQLKKMATDYDPFIRRRAAQILGRIGEIDPIQLTLSLMDNWISSGEYSQMATVGYLYEGILASQNERYRDDLLKELSSLATGEDKSEILTAIAAYQRVGVQNLHLPLAMHRFREIAERKLVEAMEDTKRIDKILTRVEGALDQSHPQTVEHMALDFYREGLSDAASRIYAENGPFLSAIQYSVVTLSLERDLFQVLHELSKWLKSDQKALGYVVTLIFLIEGGIADALESRRAEFAPDGTNDSEPRECNRLLFSIASDETSVHQMADFIRGVFAGFSDFLTPRYRRFLRDVLFWHLKKWAEDSLPIKRCREAMERLFVDLLLGPNADLNRRFSSFIRGDSDFTDRGKSLYDFACGVFARETTSAAQRNSFILV